MEYKKIKTNHDEYLVKGRKVYKLMSSDTYERMGLKEIEGEKHWFENPETGFECNNCGYTWKLKDGVICPNCLKQDKDLEN